MEDLERLLQRLQLHPVADHFTIALLTIAVLFDLVASVFPARAWLRNSGLALMILGALAAAASYATGDMEADRVWKMMSPPARTYFKGEFGFLGHGELGEVLMAVFVALAVWRLLLALFNFMAGTRPLYMMIAVIALCFLLYQGHTGGELVYVYGVGTGLMAAEASPLPTPPRSVAQPTPVPTVYAPPSPVAAASASAEATAATTAAATSSPTPAAGTTPAAHATPATVSTSARH